MYLDDFLEKLMNLDGKTAPCEVGIPCKYYNKELITAPCIMGSCLDGMVAEARKIMMKEDYEGGIIIRPSFILFGGSFAAASHHNRAEFALYTIPPNFTANFCAKSHLVILP